MLPTEIEKRLTFLTNAWCDRRQVKPLRRILNGTAELNGLTDGWAALREELRTIRARDREDLADGELDVVGELIAEIDRMISR